MKTKSKKFNQEIFDKKFYKVIHLMSDDKFQACDAIREVGLSEDEFYSNINESQKLSFKMTELFIKRYKIGTKRKVKVRANDNFVGKKIMNKK
jgi:hypothetical protein